MPPAKPFDCSSHFVPNIFHLFQSHCEVLQSGVCFAQVDPDDAIGNQSGLKINHRVEIDLTFNRKWEQYKIF